jgi:hypothetical protein
MPGSAGPLIGNNGGDNITPVRTASHCMAAILGVVLATAAILLSVTVVAVRPAPV